MHTFIKKRGQCVISAEVPMIWKRDSNIQPYFLFRRCQNVLNKVSPFLYYESSSYWPKGTF